MAARTLSMQLSEVAYTGELSQQLLEHSNLLDKHYRHLTKAIKNKCSDETWFAKIYSMLDERHSWFNEAEQAAQAILKGINQAAKKAKGGKPSKPASKAKKGSKGSRKKKTS